MIPKQMVEINLRGLKRSERQRYFDLGYKEVVENGWGTMLVDEKHLPSNSRCKIIVNCDYCGNEYFVQKNSYYTNKEKCFSETTNIDCCSDCRRNKINQTNQIKYGSNSALGSPIIREKSKETLMKNYGVDNPFKSSIIKQRANETLKSNGNVHTSSQQISIFNLLKDLGYYVEMNFPYSWFSLDVALFVNELKIDIEYDGWYWHQDENKDSKRNNKLIKDGWKILRIKSGRLLPSTKQLTDSIAKLLNTNSSFEEIVLDDWQ